MSKLYLFLLFFILPLDATTLVYNMRIRRIFSADDTTVQDKSHWIVSGVPILYMRDRHIEDAETGINVDEDIKMGGALFNLRHRYNRHWWGEVTTGLFKEHMTLSGTTDLIACRKGFDDFIIAAGYNFFPHEHVQGAVYGLAGFPTHRDINAQEFTNNLVGTRFFSIGAGAELSYGFIEELQRSLIGIVQGRIIHFFKRSWFPILPCGSIIEPGNVSDLLFTVQSRKGRGTFETGYNATIFSDQAVSLPGVFERCTDTFVRNSLYASYSYICKNEKAPDEPVIIGIGGNIGWSKRFDTRITFFWFQLTKVF